ncbi:unnamed protein product, partial [Symbiodinium pilosum]
AIGLGSFGLLPTYASVQAAQVIPASEEEAFMRKTPVQAYKRRRDDSSTLPVPALPPDRYSTPQASQPERTSPEAADQSQLDLQEEAESLAAEPRKFVDKRLLGTVHMSNRELRREEEAVRDIALKIMEKLYPADEIKKICREGKRYGPSFEMYIKLAAYVRYSLKTDGMKAAQEALADFKWRKHYPLFSEQCNIRKQYGSSPFDKKCKCEPCRCGASRMCLAFQELARNYRDKQANNSKRATQERSTRLTPTVERMLAVLEEALKKHKHLPSMDSDPDRQQRSWSPVTPPKIAGTVRSPALARPAKKQPARVDAPPKSAATGPGLRKQPASSSSSPAQAVDDQIEQFSPEMQRPSCRNVWKSRSFSDPTHIESNGRANDDAEHGLRITRQNSGTAQKVDVASNESAQARNPWPNRRSSSNLDDCMDVDSTSRASEDAAQSLPDPSVAQQDCQEMDVEHEHPAQGGVQPLNGRQMPHFSGKIIDVTGADPEDEPVATSCQPQDSARIVAAKPRLRLRITGNSMVDAARDTQPARKSPFWGSKPRQSTSASAQHERAQARTSRRQSVAPLEVRIGAKHRPAAALRIKKHWCDKIFDSTKVWEIRGSALKKRGRVCIAQSKSNHLVGEVTFVDCLKVGKIENGQLVPWSDGEDDRRHFIGAEENLTKHCIEDLSWVEYPRVFAWVMEKRQRYAKPVPYANRVGCVNWVRLDWSQGEAAVKVAEPSGLNGRDAKGAAGERAPRRRRGSQASAAPRPASASGQRAFQAKALLGA